MRTIYIIITYIYVTITYSSSQFWTVMRNLTFQLYKINEEFEIQSVLFYVRQMYLAFFENSTFCSALHKKLGEIVQSIHFQLCCYNPPCNQGMQMICFLKNYKLEHSVTSFLVTWILIKFSWVGGRGVSLASILKLAHNLWLLSCHSFWCMVLMGLPLLTIYMLAEHIILRPVPYSPNASLPQPVMPFYFHNIQRLEQIQGMQMSLRYTCHYYPPCSSFWVVKHWF